MRRRWSIGLLLLVAPLIWGTAAEAAKKTPDTAPAQLSFGVDMAKRGLWSEALFRFKQASRLRPGDPQILNNLAVAYEALGQFDKALEHYQQAIQADRSNRELKRNYSRFIEFYRAFKPDQVEGAADAAETAAASEPEGESADG